MMETSGICFVHRHAHDGGETEYVAPDLLPEGRDALADELAARWEPVPGEPLETAFAYPFLSPSIARAVLSELGQRAGSTALYWRYGLCLYDAASRASAIVEQVPDTEGYGGEIRIRVKGAGAEILLRGLVERISQLNECSGWPNRLLDAEMPLLPESTLPRPWRRLRRRLLRQPSPRSTSPTRGRERRWTRWWVSSATPWPGRV